MRYSCAGSVLALLTMSAVRLPAADSTSPAQVSVAALPLRERPGARSSFTDLKSPGLVLHVSPGGSDANPGSARSPFRSLDRARDEIRSRRQKGSLPAGGVEVRVHGGEYWVDHTFSLSSTDSGTESSPVVFKAVRGEKPIFSGGTRLQSWRPVSAADGYDLLSATAQKNIWVVDLRACGITNLLPLKLGGFASGNGFRTHPAHELFFNGEALSLARGPNDGFLRVHDVAVKDGTKGYDRTGSKTGQFIYEGDRPRRWVGEPDLLLYGYWFWDWADSYERVESIDPEQRLITLAKPWHTYGFSVGAPFYAVNALSELDVTGEWYLDRKNLRLLVYPPSDPRKAVVQLSRFAAPMLEMQDVSWVRFEGLTWDFGSADAIHLRGGAHCLFAGCTVRHFAGNGIEIHGGEQHGILACDVYSLGRGGVLVSGGDRKTLTPGGHSVENCDIHDLSRIDHTYTPAILLDGVGNRVANNRMHDVRSSAMRVGGNDHLVEYNEVYSAVTESDDQGAVDMFGNPTFRGNIYRYNYFHHIGNWRMVGEQPKCGQAGIRLDDAICGTLIRGNVFERCSAGKLGFGGVQIHGGKDNVVENNLFIDCAAMISCSPWPESRWRESVKSALDSPQIDRELYLRRYPQLAELAENANLNHISQNLALRCGELLRRAPKNLDAKSNVTLGDQDLSWPSKQLQLKHPGFDPIPFERIGLYRDARLRPR